MNRNLLAGIIFLILFSAPFAISQTVELRGQVSSWATLTETSLKNTQLGLRYIPDLSVMHPLNENLTWDARFSLNTNGSLLIRDSDDIETDSRFKNYRLWTRLATSRFEIRAGLQKINFGSAMMLRPLMWFDRIDPRDPLQITDGVYGLLVRYYFLNNANVWLWGLYGNDDVKGWEFIPSAKTTPEWGGRIQMPIPRGEMGLSVHRRKIDLEKGADAAAAMLGLSPDDVSVLSSGLGLELGQAWEERFGLDAKFDITVGFWFEGALVHQEIEWLPQKYTRSWVVGMDYTFGIGNGLNAVYEHFRFDMTEEAFGRGEGLEFGALSLNYPLGLMDTVMGMVYYDWENEEWYRFIRWQRTFDRFTFHFMGFWNPDQFQIFQNTGSENLFAGKGVQFMLVFNH